jgi:hypothetical protein
VLGSFRLGLLAFENNPQINADERRLDREQGFADNGRFICEKLLISEFNRGQ